MPLGCRAEGWILPLAPLISQAVCSQLTRFMDVIGVQGSGLVSASDSWPLSFIHLLLSLFWGLADPSEAAFFQGSICGHPHSLPAASRGNPGC